MNIITRSLVSGLLMAPTLLNAQSPMAHFAATNTAICDSVYVEGFTDQSTNSPTSWKWYFPGATPDTSTLQNPTNIMYKGYGCYTVKLVVQNNSGADSLTDSNYICLDAPPQITLTGTNGCLYSEDTVKVSGGTNYYWSTGSTNSYIVIVPIVSISIGVKVYNGACYKDTTFVMGIAPPQFVIKGYHTICLGDSSAIYAVALPRSATGCSFLWNNGSTADSLMIDPNTPGSYNYYVIVTNKYGNCPSDSAGITIKVQDCTGVKDYDDPLSKVEIFPNPNNGQFTLSLSNVNSAYSIDIYNVLGEKVYSQLPNNNSEFAINLGGQPQGIYLYRVLSESGELVGEGKVVVQK